MQQFVVSTLSLSLSPFSPQDQCIMTESIMSKAATMEIPINSNGDTGTLTEDDSLEQVGHRGGTCPHDPAQLLFTCLKRLLKESMWKLFEFMHNRSQANKRPSKKDLEQTKD